MSLALEFDCPCLQLEVSSPQQFLYWTPKAGAHPTLAWINQKGTLSVYKPIHTWTHIISSVNKITVNQMEKKRVQKPLDGVESGNSNLGEEVALLLPLSGDVSSGGGTHVLQMGLDYLHRAAALFSLLLSFLWNFETVFFFSPPTHTANDMLQGCSGNLATHFCSEAISSLISGTSWCLHHLFLQLSFQKLQKHQRSLAGGLASNNKSYPLH